MLSLLLFEDQAVTNLLPLVWTRPVWDIRCGAWTLREAIEDAYSVKASYLYTRSYLADVVHERTNLPVNTYPQEGMVLLLNGRVLADRTLPRRLSMYGNPCVYVNTEGVVIGAWLPAETLKDSLSADNWADSVAGWDMLPRHEVEIPLLTWAWDLLTHNTPRLAQQATRYPLGEFPAFQGVYMLNPDNIYIHPTATVQPGVVLNATDGPIVIDSGATVMSITAIQGPTYVGKKSTIKVGSKIYHGTSIGPVCKVGGETEEAIFQGYANKQHDGFLGHAYLGEWCNLGADTTNSDLKNNYGTATVWANGDYVNTGQLFVGLFMADHSKSAINTIFNTGTVVGVACSVFGTGFPPRYMPSFSWGGSDGLAEHRLSDALVTAERAMGRRNIVLTENEKNLLTYVFDSK